MAEERSTPPVVPKRFKPSAKRLLEMFAMAVLAYLLVSRLVRHPVFLLTAQDHGLEVLGAHHRPHATARRQASLLVDYAGVFHQVLTGLTDAQDLGPFVASLLLQGRLRLEGIHAPQVGGVAQLRALVAEKEVDRPG